MTDSETQQPVDSSQQVTSKTPATLPKQKNPKRVAAGKAIAEKNKQAREAQKKSIAEAELIIAKNQLKQAETAVTSDAAKVAENPQNVLTTTQSLSVISIFVSLVGVNYYKREEIKSLLTKKEPQANTPPPAPPPSPVDVAAKIKEGIRPMD